MAIGYEKREKFALEELAEQLEKILAAFDEPEQHTIRPRLASYTLGYLGVSQKLAY